MPMTTATIRLGFDSAHRLPNHHGKCANLHGHRYELEVTVTGDVKRQAGASDNGMLCDFAELKKTIKDCIVDPLDHKALLEVGDKCLTGDMPVIWFNDPPTAECLAQYIFDTLESEIRKDWATLWVELHNVRLFETPNCWVDVTASCDE